MNNKKLITYAYNAERKLVNINEVPNGLECGCSCPECNEKLIAKNAGNIREHHFSHVSGSECQSGYETMIHILAKDIILEKRIVPKLNCSVLHIGSEVRLDNLNIIPDVLAISEFILNYYKWGYIYKGSKSVKVPIIIEIFVTHKVDEKKAEIIKSSNICAIEIDLSKSEAMTKEELFNDIYNKPENIKVINEPFWEKTIQRGKSVIRYHRRGSHLT